MTSSQTRASLTSVYRQSLGKEGETAHRVTEQAGSWAGGAILAGAVLALRATCGFVSCTPRHTGREVAESRRAASAEALRRQSMGSATAPQGLKRQNTDAAMGSRGLKWQNIGAPHGSQTLKWQVFGRAPPPQDL